MTAELIEGKVIQGGMIPKVNACLDALNGGIRKAQDHGIPCCEIDFRARRQGFSEEIAAEVDRAAVDLVVLAGFLRPYRFPPSQAGRILNIHPALLPAFGGKGLYGDRVHEAVIRSGARFSGCTVHFVTEEYDSGPIILQRVVPVLPDDTPHSLADRVFAEECLAYPEAIRLYAEGRLEVRDGRVWIRGPR